MEDLLYHLLYNVQDLPVPGYLLLPEIPAVATSNTSNASTISTPTEAGSTIDPVKNTPSQNPTPTGSITDLEAVKNQPGEGQNLAGTG